MSVISFSQVSFAYPTIDVLTNVSFTCQAGERLCVVGSNGSGKTTLLNLALGRLSPLHGTIDAPTLASEDDAPATVGETLASTCQHIMTLREEFDAVSHDLASSSQPALMQRFDTLLNEITAANGWELERRINQTLHSLGLGSIAQDRPLSSLSPGQHERLKLAALLLGGQAALVLDEPTNHLDADAREFLIHTMTEWRGAVLFASHDRDFIERVATGILDLDTVPWDAIATVTSHHAARHACRKNFTRTAHRPCPLAASVTTRSASNNSEKARYVGLATKVCPSPFLRRALSPQASCVQCAMLRFPDA